MPKLRLILPPLVLAALAFVLFQRRISHQMPDFEVYWKAGQRAAAGAPLYRAEDGHYQFKYLPAFAIAMRPFGALDLDTGKTIWFALSFACLVILVRWSVWALPERRVRPAVLMWVAALLMAKFFGHELTLGQANAELGVLLVGAFLALQTDAPLAAAVLIGLAAFVKPYALIVLPWLATTRGLRPFVAALGVVALGLLLPVAWYGWSGNLRLIADWYHTVTESTAPNLLGADNISLAAMWAKWLGPGRVAGALTTVTAGALVALIASVWAKRRLVSEPDYLEYGLLLLAVPLLSPQGWDYVLLLATPAVICLVDRARELPVNWRVPGILAVAVMCLTIFDLMGRDLYGRFMSLSLVSAAALVLAAALAQVRWRGLA